MKHLIPILIAGIMIASCDQGNLSQDQAAMIKQHQKLLQQGVAQALPDSAVYQGEYRDNLFHGKGKLVWRNGESYEGEFQKGLMQGKGIYIIPGLTKYEGEYANGLRHGLGKYTSYDGTVFEGEFKLDRANGKGKIIFADVGTYEGDIKDWRMHGSGAYKVNKAVYSGEFVKNEQEGKGAITYSNGDHYEGDIKSWSPDGIGEYHFKNGKYYKGDFKDGVIHGNGAMTYKNKNTYSGEYQDGERHGNGTFTRINSFGEKKIHKGWWEYDEFIGEKPKNVSSESAFARLLARLKKIGSKPEKVDAETIFYNQPDLLETTLEKIKPSEPGKRELYFVGFAAYGYQDVFMKETRYAKRLFDKQFLTRGRSTTLINNHSIVDKTPLASITNLKLLLADVANKMDTEEDILFLYLTSHGSKKKGLDVSLRGLPLNDLSPKKLDELLDNSGIKWKVVVVSSCYSGGFIDELKDDYTLVMTASGKNRRSFGCSDEADFTYFARALFKHAIPDTDSFIEAFAKANQLVTEWEAKEKYTHSEPQIWAAEEISNHLLQWRSTVDMATSMARKVN